MKLFSLVNYKVEVEPGALTLAPFKALWDRDKNNNKSRAIAEFSFIWFMYDLKSDFAAVINESERAIEVSKVIVGLPKDWKPDSKVKEAADFYLKFSETASTKLLRDSRAGLEKISDILKNPDFDKVDIKKIADTIRMLPSLVESLDRLEEQVLKEQTVVKHRGSQERAIFEDGV